MPIVRAIGEGLAGDRITRIVAILNGTTNAVLSRMEATGCALDEAVARRARRGYAEADPSADLDGLDARAKLAILCALAFGLRVDPSQIDDAIVGVDRRRPTSRGRGSAARPSVRSRYADYDRAASALDRVGRARSRSTRASIFARTTGPQNAALITGAHAGEIGIFGAGAGGDATAVAILGDIAAIARDRAGDRAGADPDVEFQIAEFRFSDSRSSMLAEAV